MSDRAKARLLAAGLSVLLSAQVVLILLGALVFFNRVYLGGGKGAIGSIFGNQPQVILPGVGTGGAGAGPGAGGGQPGNNPGPGPGPTQPPGCTTDCAPEAQPLIGVTAQADVPIVGTITIPLRLGTSSGDNYSTAIPLPRARVDATMSRRPICDLTKCTGGSSRASDESFKVHVRPALRLPKKDTHVPFGQSLAHAIERALRSLLH